MARLFCHCGCNSQIRDSYSPLPIRRRGTIGNLFVDEVNDFLNKIKEYTDVETTQKQNPDRRA